MGISIVAALAALAYSLYIQSPSRQVAFQVEPYRLASRIRAATTMAFALLLLTFGFYVAGVPLDEAADGAADSAESQPLSDQAVEAIVNATLTAMPPSGDSSGLAVASFTQTPASGAFGAPLDEDATAEAVAAADVDVEEVIESVVDSAESEAEPTATPTPEPSATATNTPTPTATPTQTPTPLPTATPTPTLTPTPISDDTARVSTGGSTLWVKRSPGGQNLVILRDGDIVILQPGNANQSGLLWKEIRTVDGVNGWVQAQFLDFGGDDSAEE